MKGIIFSMSQGEITSISTAAQQIEVFSRILKNSIVTFLQSDEDSPTKNMSECAKMVCHGQHTYVYAQVLLSVLAVENKVADYKSTCSNNMNSLKFVSSLLGRPHYSETSGRDSEASNQL